MTLDMLEVLVDAIVRTLDSVSEVEHYAALLFIMCVLGVGSTWALALVVKDYSINIFRKVLF